MGLFDELRAGAAENEKAHEEAAKAYREKVRKRADREAEEINSMLAKAGAALDRQKAAELQNRQEEAKARAEEAERLEDIRKNGSNETNDKEKRQALRNMLQGLTK